MSEPEQPKPCPFCGTAPIFTEDEYGLHGIRCDASPELCPAVVRIEAEGTRSDAIRAWNRRKEPSR